ncbi:hypothetical protein C8J56DRAFT_971004 [Mycena floridula]|nr:hypothetical protein C8J56DRAFT_971004 [Mycena floridula]
MQWYQSPQLAEGIHSIKLDKLNGTGVDYILVMPGQDTLLTNRILAIDDSYVEIDYVNHWETDLAAAVRGGGSAITGVAFQNTTHFVSIEGAYLKFSYFGTTAAVYGIFSWTQLGSYDLTVSVDDQEPFTVIFNASATRVDADAPDQPNLKLFNTGDLPAGNHTIIANLTRCDNQTLVIDYIQYNPSFSSLATMPNLTDTTSTSGSPPGASQTPLVTKKSSVGAIAGGVVGGIALLAIVTLLLLWWRRWKTKPESHDAFRPSGPMTVEPFLDNPSTSGVPKTITSSGFSPLRRNSGSATSSGPSGSRHKLKGSTNGQEDSDLMRRQIQELREENERLARMAKPPPAYADT